ncbi:MAG TPA: hypothetical protein VF857_05605 [Spirochaetota bacterium]
MNKRIIFVLVLMIAVGPLARAVVPDSNFSEPAIEKIRITDSDLPEGFMYGQIPDFAKNVLLQNPWEMNRAAINKVTKNLYPSGDPGSVRNMHLSILAKKEHTYGYDIVCYIIIYNDGTTARKEIEKLSDFNRYNSDRTILLYQGNLAVFLIVQDVANYKYIQEMKEKMQQRINTL